ncbi:hypothetical protein MP638_005382 [Amoeboaphelidium occidentale]|nr:hypothetical protein MP638_005382 [Amoeboaphelidium occidentale]
MLFSAFVAFLAVPGAFALDLNNDKVANKIAEAMIRFSGAKNGELSREQFYNAINMASGGAFGLKAVEIDFEELDTDKSGSLNKEEIVAFLQTPEGEGEVDIEYLEKHVDEEKLAKFGEKAFNEMHKEACVDGEAAQTFEEYKNCKESCTVLQCKKGFNKTNFAQKSNNELEELQRMQTGLIIGSVLLIITAVGSVFVTFWTFLAMFVAPVFIPVFLISLGVSFLAIVGSHFILKQISINSRKIRALE